MVAEGWVSVTLEGGVEILWRLAMMLCEVEGFQKGSELCWVEVGVVVMRTGAQVDPAVGSLMSGATGALAMQRPEMKESKRSLLPVEVGPLSQSCAGQRWAEE